MWIFLGIIIFGLLFFWAYKSLDLNHPIGWVMAIVIVIFAILFFTSEFSTHNELQNEYWVTLKVKYCSGESEEVFLTINGDPKYLHVKNRSRDLAVPELIGLDSNTAPYLINVCSFEIISTTKLNK